MAHNDDFDERITCTVPVDGRPCGKRMVRAWLADTTVGWEAECADHDSEVYVFSVADGRVFHLRDGQTNNAVCGQRGRFMRADAARMHRDQRRRPVCERCLAIAAPPC